LDREKDARFSLNNYYFTDDRVSSDRQLTNLKRRMCRFNATKLRADMEARKKKTFLNQMVFYDRYNDFQVFNSPSVPLVLQLLFAILDHNASIDTRDDQQFLCFFEPLLQRQAAATRIQQSWRAYLFRKSFESDRSKLPIYKIIKRRAALCVQSWWSNMKLRKRMLALQNIRNHVMKINSHEIYIEQTIYQHIDQVVDIASRGFRFEEQAIMFDFNTEHFGIKMQVEEDLNIKGVRRFTDCSVPRWFDIRLQPPEFEHTPYMNILRAIFHFNQGDCEIVPSTNVINYKKCQMEIDRNIYFVKITCTTVEEARKRAIVLAYLSYDMTRHLFVKFSSA
jgi:hypothetical protein